jgi:glycosyltransferase involved in cell wall biosynthesis
MPDGNKKRILHAISLDHIGGVEVLFHAYLERADKQRMEHHVLLLRGRCHRHLEPVVRRHAASISLAKYRGGIKLPRKPISLRQRNLRRIFHEIRPDVTLIHNTPGNPLLWDTASEAGGRIIYYEHGGAWRTREIQVPSNLRKAALIICNSRAAKRMLELRWRLPDGRAQVNINPLRPEISLLESEAKPFPDGRRARIGIAGRLVPVKGFPLALHALHRLSTLGMDAELLIAGIGSDKRLLQKLAAQLGIADRIQFLGHVRNMSSFFDRIDLFLCPSLREPLGNVCIEAAARGCPVVCTCVDGLPEAVQHGKTGLCIPPTLPAERYRDLGGHTEDIPLQVYDPIFDALSPVRLPDPAAMAEAMLALLRSREQFVNMSRAARLRAANEFRLDDYVASMDRILLS